jgi:hypothetical protein
MTIIQLLVEPGSGLAGRSALAGRLVVHAFDLREWSGRCSLEDREQALYTLESGKIVFLPHLPFVLTAGEQRFLDPLVSNGKAKNISFDRRTGTVIGSSIVGDEREELGALLRRFGQETHALLTGLFPDYASHLETGRTSLRPVAIDRRRMSYRKDDRRLHVDAFRSQPLRGQRILRVFANVNVRGVGRVWRVGGSFTDYANRFLRRQWFWPMPFAAATLEFLGITKGRRTVYDWLMLSLHDRAKADRAYQHDGVVAEIVFSAGSTWIVYSDVVPHAAIAGQHALEQTFYLPVAAMRDPTLAPLRILEGLIQRPLAG